MNLNRECEYNGNFEDAELEIIAKAKEALKREVGLELTVTVIEKKVANNLTADAEVKIDFGNIHFIYLAEVKKFLTTQTIGAVAEQIKRLGEKTILITKYINPRMAERLKINKIQFLDGAGNAYLNEPPLFIWVAGRQLGELEKRKAPPKAFTTTGLKVIFAILCNQNLLNVPYRQIAKKADVALGTVGWVFTDLRDKGFLLDLKRGKRVLRNKLKLLDRWVEAYADYLRPKLLAGRYETKIPDWWKTIDPHKDALQWGGEVAAAKLTHFLAPEYVTIYKRKNIGNFVAQYKIQKAINGKIEILKPFWDETIKCPRTDLVHPFLIYADLVATGEPRNLEVAKEVYNEHIVRLI